MSNKFMKIKKYNLTLLLEGLLIIIPLITFALFSTISNSNLNGITQYESEIFPKTSAIQDINIVSPVNNTNITPESGYFPATYGFENDEGSTVPDGWTKDCWSSCDAMFIIIIMVTKKSLEWTMVVAWVKRRYIIILNIRLQGL